MKLWLFGRFLHLFKEFFSHFSRGLSGLFPHGRAWLIDVSKAAQPISDSVGWIESIP
jgi:hypothetical protein